MAILNLNRSKSNQVLVSNERYIPGGVVSIVRKTEPAIAFTRGQGAYLWDVDGNRYLDYHAAFAPMVLGHNDPYVNEAVQKVVSSGSSLYGSGSNELDGQLAEMLCTHVPAAEMVEFLNTGTEASMASVRLARACTGRDHVIVMQGGFNGSHNDVACNVLTPLDKIGSRVSPGEYPFVPLGPGIPESHAQLVHVINFNDLDSVRYVCDRYDVAALVTEPILQNIGIMKPKSGYLEGLRKLADEYGFVLIFDEVKTGFRYSLGGYSQVSGVQPDLVYFAKAVANGYPFSVLGGKKDLMAQFAHPDPSRQPICSGTYNGHPIPVTAAIATLERLLEGDCQIYRQLESLGQQCQTGIEEILRSRGITGTVARQGSAFCIYLMDHSPVDWHDLAENHDFKADVALRQAMVNKGIYFFPVATKQCSISAAHTESDIADTLETLDSIMAEQ